MKLLGGGKLGGAADFIWDDEVFSSSSSYLIRDIIIFINVVFSNNNIAYFL